MSVSTATQATCLFATATATKAPAQAPPKLELVLGRKWSIENHTNNRSLYVDQTDPKQSVYIFNCSNCTVQVCTYAPLCSTGSSAVDAKRLRRL